MAEPRVTPALWQRFGIGRDLVAFVGGGGKSTLTLEIGRELAEAARPVVITTTTKMGVDQIPTWATVCRDETEVITACEKGSPAFLLGSIEGPKVLGTTPDLVDRIFHELGATVLVEADGARRRPFKAPGPHEPVIPSATTMGVVVAGADALDRPIGETCHRPERVAALTGRRSNHVLRPEDLVAVVVAPDGGRKRMPDGARLVLALTKVAAKHQGAVDEIARSLPDDIGFVPIDAA